MYNVKPYFTLRNFHRSLLSFVLAFILFSISQFSVSTLLTDGRALARLLPKMPAAHAQSVITVTSASTMIAKDGDCTLPEAIVNANVNRKSHEDCAAGRGEDRIQFQIAGPGPHTIIVNRGGELIITDPLFIDGLSQPPNGGTAATCGPKRSLLIELDGRAAGIMTGLTILDTQNVTIRGLVVHSFGGSGIQVHNSSNVEIQCNNVGTDDSGSTALPNLRSGIQISNNSQFVTVGTNSDAQGDANEYNVVSGNDGAGVLINGSSNIVVAGNLIGTNGIGTRALPNTGIGVQIFNGSRGNQIGTNSDGISDQEERNIISGNANHGLSIFGIGTNHNRISGNYIGPNIDSERVIGNGVAGINVTGGALGTVIGGRKESDQNIISGNESRGIWVQTGYPDFVGGIITSKTTIQNNWIGLNASGKPMRNKNQGILIELSADNKIIENIVAENSARGIYVVGAEALITDNIIVNNNHSGIEITYFEGANHNPEDEFTKADDVISMVDLKGNIIEGNCRSGVRLCAGILGLDDSVDPGDSSKGVVLSRSNIINANNDRPDVAQYWYGAVGLQGDHAELAGRSFVLESSNGGPSYNLSSMGSSGKLFSGLLLRGGENFKTSDLSSWHLYRDFIIKADGTPVVYQLKTVISDDYASSENTSTFVETGISYQGKGLTYKSHPAYHTVSKPLTLTRYKIIRVTVPILALSTNATAVDGSSATVTAELNLPLTEDVMAVVSIYDGGSVRGRSAIKSTNLTPLLTVPFVIPAGNLSTDVAISLPSQLFSETGRWAFLLQITDAELALTDGKTLTITAGKSAKSDYTAVGHK